MTSFYQLGELNSHFGNGGEELPAGTLSFPSIFTPDLPAAPRGAVAAFQAKEPNRHIPLLEFAATHSKQSQLTFPNRHTFGCFQLPAYLRSSVFNCGSNPLSLAAVAALGAEAALEAKAANRTRQRLGIAVTYSKQTIEAISNRTKLHNFKDRCPLLVSPVISQNTLPTLMLLCPSDVLTSMFTASSLRGTAQRGKPPCAA